MAKKIEIIKNKYLFSALFIIFLFWGANFVSALEVNLGLGDNPTLGDYVGYLFGWGISIAGTLALISFVVGAVGLIASGDNAEAASNSKDRMKGAVLGLVLTLASFLIIQTINPALTTFTLTPLTPVPGVYLVKNSNEQTACPESVADTSTLPAGYNTIKYTCPNNGGPVLLVWTFPNTDFEYVGAEVKRVSCGGTLGISGGSFQIAFETPGVYYFLGSGCAGYGSGANISSQDKLADPFPNAKSVRIVDDIVGDPVYDLHYGVIFHKEIGLENGGLCTLPITGDGCHDIPASTGYYSNYAADIFTLNSSTGASGDGVIFYSEPFGDLSGTGAGMYRVNDADISTPYLRLNPLLNLNQNNSDAMLFDYTGENLPDAYENRCDTFRNCPGSINIQGNYLVGLYSLGPAQDPNARYCQTFDKPVFNLNTEPFVASGGRKIDLVYIIPTQ